MDDRPPDHDINDRPGRGSAANTPRWVKGFGIIALVLVLLVVIAMLTGGGDHGPGRHTSSGATGDDPPVSRVTDEHRPREGDGG